MTRYPNRKIGINGSLLPHDKGESMVRNRGERLLRNDGVTFIRYVQPKKRPPHAEAFFDNCQRGRTYLLRPFLQEVPFRVILSAEPVSLSRIASPSVTSSNRSYQLATGNCEVMMVEPFPIRSSRISYNDT